MGLDVQISGLQDLGKVRRALKKVGDDGLGKQMARAQRQAVEPLKKEILAEVPKAMPSGYAPTLSKSLRFRQQVKEQRELADLVLRVYGDGTKERRDVPRLNRGELRHPVFGRSRRTKRGRKPNPWVAQKIRKGFVDRPADRLAPQVRREMDAVVRYVADQITKG